MVRMLFDLPRQTHCYLIKPISACGHLKEMLIRRFIKFYNSLSKCQKPSVKYLMALQEKDGRSVFGRNIRNILKECHAEKFSEAQYIYKPVPDDQQWRVHLLKELLESQAYRYDCELSRQQISETIDFLSIT